MKKIIIVFIGFLIFNFTFSSVAIEDKSYGYKLGDNKVTIIYIDGERDLGIYTIDYMIDSNDIVEISFRNSTMAKISLKDIVNVMNKIKRNNKIVKEKRIQQVSKMIYVNEIKIGYIVIKGNPTMVIDTGAFRLFIQDINLYEMIKIFSSQNIEYVKKNIKEINDNALLLD